MTDRDSNGQSLEVYDRRLSSRLPLRVVGRVLLRRRRPRPPGPHLLRLHPRRRARPQRQRAEGHQRSSD